VRVFAGLIISFSSFGRDATRLWHETPEPLLHILIPVNQPRSTIPLKAVVVTVYQEFGAEFLLNNPFAYEQEVVALTTKAGLVYPFDPATGKLAAFPASHAPLPQACNSDS
jgi:hypothetical protein